jgi:hypothetical protein
MHDTKVEVPSPRFFDGERVSVRGGAPEGRDRSRHALNAKSHGADPDRHGNEKGAHANQRDDILNQIGHNSLLLLICFQFVLILF